jgi:hypothetical protein
MASKDMTFMPNFLKTSELVRKLKWGKHRYHYDLIISIVVYYLFKLSVTYFGLTTIFKWKYIMLISGVYISPLKMVIRPKHVAGNLKKLVNNH